MFTLPAEMYSEIGKHLGGEATGKFKQVNHLINDVVPISPYTEDYIKRKKIKKSKVKNSKRKVKNDKKWDQENVNDYVACLSSWKLSDNNCFIATVDPVKATAWVVNKRLRIPSRMFNGHCYMFMLYFRQNYTDYSPILGHGPHQGIYKKKKTYLVKAIEKELHGFWGDVKVRCINSMGPSNISVELY